MRGKAPRRRSPLQRAVAGLLCVALGGCYSYVPIEDGAGPAPDQEVRVTVVEGASGGRASAPSQRTLQGIVVESDPDSLALSVRRSAAERSGFAARTTARDTLRFVRSEIRQIATPRLDALRTGAAAVLGLGLVVGVAALVLGADGGGGGLDGGGGGGPTLDRVAP